MTKQKRIQVIKEAMLALRQLADIPQTDWSDEASAHLLMARNMARATAKLTQKEGSPGIGGSGEPIYEETPINRGKFST